MTQQLVIYIEQAKLTYIWGYYCGTSSPFHIGFYFPFCSSDVFAIFMTAHMTLWLFCSPLGLARFFSWCTDRFVSKPVVFYFFLGNAKCQRCVLPVMHFDQSWVAWWAVLWMTHETVSCHSTAIFCALLWDCISIPAPISLEIWVWFSFLLPLHYCWACGENRSAALS